MKKLYSALLVAVMVLALPTAEAARMGGGKSTGRQSSNVTQREAATAPGGVAPAQNASTAAAAKPAAAPAATPQAPAKRPWGAMLGGLAAGLGLAWLAHSLGLGAEFGNMLMIALLAMAAFAVIGMVMRSRKQASAGQGGAPFAFQGAGAATPDAAQVPRQYSPDKVGNDASARPWERSGAAFDTGNQSSGSGVVIGSALAGSQSWGIPDGFDVAGFVAAAKRNFVSLQAAWDRADIASLRAMMTDGMLEEIKAQLAERESHGGSQPNQTDVVMIEAQLLGIEDLGDAYMASVEFSGMIREDASSGPNPFREVWNMTKPKSGNGGWLVAGVQALQ